MGYTDKSYFATKINEDELNNLTGANEGDTGETNLNQAISSADSLVDEFI